MAIHAAIAEKREELAQLWRRHGAARLEGFGSAARGTDFDPGSSDADFLVKFTPEGGRSLLQQYFNLRGVLGRPVDLAASGAAKNPFLRAAIDKERDLVDAT